MTTTAQTSTLPKPLTLAQEIEDKLGMVYALDGLAWQAAAREEPLRAARLWGASERGHETLKIAYSREERDLYDGLIEAARQQRSRKPLQRPGPKAMPCCWNKPWEKYCEKYSVEEASMRATAATIAAMSTPCDVNPLLV